MYIHSVIVMVPDFPAAVHRVPADTSTSTIHVLPVPLAVLGLPSSGTTDPEIPQMDF